MKEDFNKNRFKFDNGNYYISNYVEILYANNRTDKGEIIDINPESNYIRLRIYRTKNNYFDMKIFNENIKNIKLIKRE